MCPQDPTIKTSGNSQLPTLGSHPHDGEDPQVKPPEVSQGQTGPSRHFVIQDHSFSTGICWSVSYFFA